MSNFKTRLKRLYIASGTSDHNSLADFLGIPIACVSAAEQYGHIPADWLLLLLRVKGVNPDWILNGTGARFLHGSYAEHDGQYVDGHTEREAQERLAVIRSATAQELAEELLRRIAL